MGDT
jgi:hypothetical protein